MNDVARVICTLCSLVIASEVSAEPTALDDFVRKARDHEIVFVGEIHDNPSHHANQARIVAALKPAALVFEMVPRAQEDVLNRLRDEGASREDIANGLLWEQSGWPEFDYYAQIMEAAPEARVFGSGEPVEVIRAASAEGAASAFGADAEVYGLDAPLDPEDQAAREAMQFAAHCDALPKEMLPGMVEVQRFRDAKIANAALWARTTTGGPVVVITGSGHANKRVGAPAALAVAAPETSVLSLGQFESAPEDPDAFDAYLLSEAPERDEPCAVFAKDVEKTTE